MSTKYWSDAQTSELIQLLEQNECLWNPNCPQFRDRTKRGLALAKMAIKLKHSAKQIRTKIKNLRSQYSTIAKMNKRSSKKPSWKYFSALQFMFENVDDINYDDTMDVKVSELPKLQRFNVSCCQLMDFTSIGKQFESRWRRYGYAN